MREGEDFQKLSKEGKVLVSKVNIEMFAVLTEEQLKKMSLLVNNPPDRIKDSVKKIERLFEKESDLKYSFLKAWKLGVVVQLRQEKSVEEEENDVKSSH